VDLLSQTSSVAAIRLEGGRRARRGPRGTTEEAAMSEGANSSRLVTGTMAIIGDSAATAETAVKQTGQMWEGDGAAVKSVQKWNCAARKTTPRSNARMRMRRDFVCMCLLGRSLGRNGCWVKFGILSAGAQLRARIVSTSRRDTFWLRRVPGGPRQRRRFQPAWHRTIAPQLRCRLLVRNERRLAAR
jgi:hypothetical protein